ncbi:MAG: 50S ribosomal protein L37ae [Candidatus Marsarchaeota archaeon]|nr:50S ribosomal protein L37ae [Candidatus Marsarchaeota archaeon]MCL5102169.1 50S ribosomal protein L37ae [Candidatus Marsarchaeota archaeon]
MASPNIRYGARIRKRQKAVKADKIALYKCESCGKVAVKRISTSIWRCRHCGATYAGGAYTMTTAAGEVARRQVESIGKENK